MPGWCNKSAVWVVTSRSAGASGGSLNPSPVSGNASDVSQEAALAGFSGYVRGVIRNDQAQTLHEIVVLMDAWQSNMVVDCEPRERGQRFEGGGAQMSRRTAARLAWSLAGLTFFLMAGTVFLVWLGRSSPSRADGENSLAYQVIAVLGNLPAPIIGALIATRQPRNSYGWIWLVSGFALSFMQFAAAYAFHGLLIAPGTLPMVGLALSLAGAAWFLTLATGPFVLLLFPTGHLPSPKWRIVAWATVGALLTGLALGWAMPGQSNFVPIENPYGAQGIAGDVVVVAVELSAILIFIAIIAGVVSLLLSFRGATGVERQQLKWFTYGGVLLGVVLFSDLFYTIPGVWESVKEAIAFSMLPPLTIGIAILRYRLYDIDVLINRTLVYGLLTAALTLIYIGSVVLLQTIVTAFTNLSHSELVTVASTLVIAALFTPLRRRIQDVIDRRFYRRKYDAAKTLQVFGAKLRNETDLDALAADLVAVVDVTMQPAHVSLWLRAPEQEASVGRAVLPDGEEQRAQ